MDIENLVAKQRSFFLTGKTRSYAFRLEMLDRLRQAVQEYEKDLADAMKEDMNKCPSEVYMTETGMVLEELRYCRRHLKKWMKPEYCRTPLAQFPSCSFIQPEPYGVSLIMSPWNYPIQLSLEPLIGAISAGCTAVLKPSAYSGNTSRVLREMLNVVYPQEYVAVVEGGRAENQELMHQKFDYIFFTGSPEVGHEVMRCAAENLTPMTLELGGKSPVIVDETADLKIAARRIAFGKTLNAGQTCVEPDYLLIHRDVKTDFIREYQKALDRFFPKGDYWDMNVIINQKHFDRLSGLMGSGDIVLGGRTDPERRRIEPTLLDNVPVDSPIMQEEIFGPILPMLTYTSLETAVEFINDRPRPLALYLFTRNRKAERYVLDHLVFGGGCINDTIIHLATSRMPFGGVGNSGMGGYHGKYSFDTFTHYCSIVKKANWLDLPIRYRPYRKYKDRIVRMLMK